MVACLLLGVVKLPGLLGCNFDPKEHLLTNKCNGLGWCYVSLVDKWGFPEMGVPPNGWFIRENPIQMDEN